MYINSNTKYSGLLSIIFILTVTLMQISCNKTEGIDSSSACYESNEICDGVDNNCNGEIDEANVCPDIKWNFNTDDKIKSSAAIDLDGNLYFGSSSGKLFSLKPDGTKRWEFLTNGKILSSPAVIKGTVYVGSTDGFLYAIDSYGDQVWKYYTGKEIVSSVSIGSDGSVYIGTLAHTGSQNAALYALNPNGKVKWVKAFHRGNIYSSPSIAADGTIYITLAMEDNDSSYGKIYAYDSNGYELWKFRSDYPIFSSPSIGLDGTVYLLSSNLYAITPDGVLKWKFECNTLISSFVSPVISEDETIYFPGYNVLYAVNSDGILEWKIKTDNIMITTPAIDSNGTIYIGTLSDESNQDGDFYAINKSGNFKWQMKTYMGVGTWSSPTIAPDGTLFVGTENNSMLAIKTDSYGLANSSWPKFRGNYRNTGNIAF